MEILNAREEKSKKINNLLHKYNTIISIKANIAGSDKNIFPAHYLVNYFKEKVLEIIVGEVIFYESHDGPYYLIMTNSDISKKQLMSIEDTPLGRLIDIDLYSDNKSISRYDIDYKLRKCLICDDNAFNCIRQKKHSLHNVHHKILEITILSLCNEAMDRELNLENKFGLVTKTTSASHQDMNYEIMIKAKNAILPYLCKLFFLGYYEKDFSSLQKKARIIGIEAENAMFNTTNNVNCYQGLIFILGMTLVSTGYVISSRQSFSMIFQNLKEITKGITKEVSDRTYKGAREEAEMGLNSVRSLLEKNIKNDIMKLIYFIQNIDDTVLIKRSQTIEKYFYYKKLINEITSYNEDKIKEISDIFIENNLSCGGSADLLIVTFFLEEIRKDFLEGE